jgi:hypothetical protein
LPRPARATDPATAVTTARLACTVGFTHQAGASHTVLSTHLSHRQPRAVRIADKPNVTHTGPRPRYTDVLDTHPKLAKFARRALRIINTVAVYNRLNVSIRILGDPLISDTCVGEEDTAPIHCTGRIELRRRT